ncbi:hypothetical protein J7E38_16070 [Bacillus sp. ISL-35]|uniref:hypothetical protein n=1 Tax=Bacillus sp. ISL-35 TaxID=2819122 RepID=UPI001BEC8F35|nr:hypothetical protein [Bacillus sp. ISL-35]MBT2680526.1 hypothetical protein [Bacillus sp. ISL-35]MBT2704180.1 hypothetical protein [Chryseobacterium sp. ISL-80]
MKRIPEQQLQKVRDVGFNRLSPDGLRTFLVVSFILSLWFTLIPFFADKTNNFQVPWITAFLTILFILWVLQGITIIVFMSIERAYRYQNWLVILVNIFYVKLIVEGFGGYFLSVKGEHPYLIGLGIAYISFTIAFLLWSIQRAKINIEKGEGTIEGKGILYSGHFKLWPWLPVLMYVLLLAVLTLFFFGGIGNGWYLAIVMPMVLGLSYAYPEFFFLAYGKWKFPSFFDANMPSTKKTPAPKVNKGRKVR